ncbi:DsbA family protein [Demequina oxidasica]|uniref:DsbA family protein n=1 Tax=Demequina oxidasica TaxID=676199 RepID=UPI000783E242|nr:thioredoxin domain-containing protein [Demequina oxidasica]
MASKNEKAAQARALAQAQVHQKERKSTMIIIAASVVGLLIFGGIVFFIVNSSKIPALTDAGAVLPAGSDETGGIPVGSTGTVGVDVPGDDVTRVDIYEDFMCPICNQFEQTNAADLDELREAGEISVYYHPISILDRVSLGTDYSTRAANAAATIADQSPEHFHEFAEALYANQPEENTEGLSDATMADIAVSVGVSQDVANSIADGDFRKWVAAATDQASQDGMSGTPTVMVNREILDQTEVSYFNPGTLKAYLESL